MLKLSVSIVVGSVLGVLGSRYLFVGSWLSLIPWGSGVVCGLVLGLVGLVVKDRVLKVNKRSAG